MDEAANATRGTSEEMMRLWDVDREVSRLDSFAFDLPTYFIAIAVLVGLGVRL